MCVCYSLPYSISIIYTLYTTTIHYIGNLAIIIFIGVRARIGWDIKKEELPLAPPSEINIKEIKLL